MCIRDRLQSCDIVYAPVGDIPWREDAFDTVLMQWKGDADSLDRMLGEVPVSYTHLDVYKRQR